MIFALAKISGLFDWFNHRRPSEKELFEICQLENILVVFWEMPILRGFICKSEGQNYIFLDNELRGFELLYIALHELAHYFLHEPTNKVQVRFYSLARPNKDDDEADAVALLWLFPKNFVEKHLEIEPEFESDFEREKWQKRLELYRKFDE
jgi:Zn-dependent peptidase ImmA (M78 family)